MQSQGGEGVAAAGVERVGRLLGGGLQGHLDDTLTTLALHRSTTLWEPARRRLEEVVAHRLRDIDERLERVTLELLPLSPEEQAQLALMLQVPGEEEIVSTALQIARRLQVARDEGRRRAAAIDPSLATSTPARPLHGANSAKSDI